LSSPSLLPVRWLPCHAIYLKKDGKLSAHVDSVRYSGRVVAGISLLSPSIMRLKPASPSEISSSMNGEDDTTHVTGIEPQDSSTGGATFEDSKSLDDSGHVDLYLPPLSLYILTGVSRYRYTHALLPSGPFFANNNEEDLKRSESFNIQVDREDRISVVFRDAKVS